MDVEEIYLCNFDKGVSKQSEISDLISEKLEKGEWSFFLGDKIFKDILFTNLNADSLKEYVNKYSSEEKFNNVMPIAISCFMKFCEYNWFSGNDQKLDEVIGLQWPQSLDVCSLLSLNGEEVDINIIFPELFFFAYEVIKALAVSEDRPLYQWWLLRCKLVHQRMLDENSPIIFNELEIISARLLNYLAELNEQPQLQILLCMELSQAYIMYGRIKKVEDLLDRAKRIAGLKLELKGLLGKRTKFQQTSLPQLALSAEIDSSKVRYSADVTHGSLNLPNIISLNDDLRLDKVNYTHDEIQNVELTSLEQLICLLNVQYLQRSQPKDNLADEELLPYIESILSQGSGPWTVRVAALLIKCKLESNNKRTIERAMMQCEALVNNSSATINTANISRLSYLWASGLPGLCNWRHQLADLYLNIGLVKAALDEYLKLQLWEDIIVCYTLLQLRHKAAEIIKQQIEIKPTVKLYCLLGDATDDEACYSKAWEFSGEKSSRAQRHWGNFLFSRKKYKESIPHYQKSLEINSLQESVWLHLGYAALMVEDWEVSGAAYRRYTFLEPNTFEAWNNLAKVYVKQGDKNRAHKALLESLKFNYDNWKVWENIIVVSLDTGHFDDVIRGYHRLLDLQGKHLDLEVLQLLIGAILQDKPDADGNPCARLRNKTLELFGRITSIYPNDPTLWLLYADLTPSKLLKSQRLQKCYRGFTHSGNWSNDPATCEKVINIVDHLVSCSLDARKEAEGAEIFQADQQLSSARLTAQGVIKISEKQNWPELEKSLQDLKKSFDDIMNFLKSQQ